MCRCGWSIRSQYVRTMRTTVSLASEPEPEKNTRLNCGWLTSPSNAEFDAFLKQRDPLSGIRDIEAVDALASAAGFTLQHDHALPANNRLLIWQR